MILASTKFTLKVLYLYLIDPPIGGVARMGFLMSKMAKMSVSLTDTTVLSTSFRKSFFA